MDSDQSNDGTSDYLDGDSNIIPPSFPFDSFDALISNTAEHEKIMPPRTYADYDFEALLNEDEEFDGKDDEELIMNNLAMRVAIQAMTI